LNLEIIKKYYEPKSILDIGANVGQFYNKCKSIFTDSYYYLIEGNLKCEEALKQLNVDYSMSLISDEIKEVDFYTRIHEERCTGNSIYREKTSFFDDDQILLEKRLTSTLNDLLPNKTFVVPYGIEARQLPDGSGKTCTRGVYRRFRPLQTLHSRQYRRPHADKHIPYK
jgi:hypothetical protein